jgi:phage baseplate assembly protein gpV
MTEASSSFLNLAQRLGINAEQWNMLLWQALCDLRVAMPCQVVSFDATKQTVSVQPTIRENINLHSVPTPTALPVLEDVPIHILGAGNFVVTVPIQAGDECVVLFADMCINAWWEKGDIQNQEDRRRHDLSDGIAIFGLKSQPNRITNYSTDKMQARSLDGTVVVELGTNEIAVTAPTVTINGSTKVEIDSANLVNINGSGQTHVDGKIFLQHKHTGVQTGGGVSGPVF